MRNQEHSLGLTLDQETFLGLTGSLRGAGTGGRSGGAGTAGHFWGAGTGGRTGEDTAKRFRGADTGTYSGAGADTGVSSETEADTGASSGNGADTGASSGAGADTLFLCILLFRAEEREIAGGLDSREAGGFESAAGGGLETAVAHKLDLGTAVRLDWGLTCGLDWETAGISGLRTETVLGGDGWSEHLAGYVEGPGEGWAGEALWFSRGNWWWSLWISSISRLTSHLYLYSAFNNTNCNKSLHNIKIGKLCQ